MDKIESLIQEGRISEAIAELDNEIAQSSAHDAVDHSARLSKLYFMRGKLHWRLGNSREALNDYSYSVSLDPVSPAATALAQAREIMNFHAPDLYNP